MNDGGGGAAAERTDDGCWRNKTRRQQTVVAKTFEKTILVMAFIVSVDERGKQKSRPENRREIARKPQKSVLETRFRYCNIVRRQRLYISYRDVCGNANVFTTMTLYTRKRVYVNFFFFFFLSARVTLRHHNCRPFVSYSRSSPI